MNIEIAGITKAGNPVYDTIKPSYKKLNEANTNMLNELNKSGGMLGSVTTAVNGAVKSVPDMISGNLLKDPMNIVKNTITGNVNNAVNAVTGTVGKLTNVASTLESQVEGIINGTIGDFKITTGLSINPSSNSKELTEINKDSSHNTNREWPKPVEDAIMGLPPIVMSGESDMQTLFERSFPILEITPIKLDGSNNLRNASTSKLKDAPTYKFAIQNTGGIRINTSNKFGPSQIEKTVQGVSSQLGFINELKQMTRNSNMLLGKAGSPLVNDLSGKAGRFIQNALGKGAGDLRNIKATPEQGAGIVNSNLQDKPSWKALAGDLEGSALNFMSMISAGILGGRIDMPNIWQESTGNVQATIQIDLRCRNSGTLVSNQLSQEIQTSNKMLGYNSLSQSAEVAGVSQFSGKYSKTLNKILSTTNGYFNSYDNSNVSNELIGNDISSDDQYQNCIVRPLACILALALPYRYVTSDDNNGAMHGSALVYENPVYLEARIGSTFESKCCAISNLSINIDYKEYSYIDDRPLHVTVSFDLVDMFNVITWDNRTLTKKTRPGDSTPNSARIINNLAGTDNHNESRRKALPPSIIDGASSNSVVGTLSPFNLMGGAGDLLGSVTNGIQKVLDFPGQALNSILPSETSCLLNSIIGGPLKSTIKTVTNSINRGMSQQLTSLVNGHGFDLSAVGDNIKSGVNIAGAQLRGRGIAGIAGQIFGAFNTGSTSTNNLLDTASPVVALVSDVADVVFKGGINDINRVNFKLKTSSLYENINEPSYVKFYFDKPTEPYDKNIVQDQIDEYIAKSGKDINDITTSELKVNRVDKIYNIEYVKY